MHKHRQVFLRGYPWFFGKLNLYQNPHLLSLSTDQNSHSFISKLLKIFLVCVSLSFWHPVEQWALLLNTTSQPLQANVGSSVTPGNVERATSDSLWPTPVFCILHRKGLCQGEGMSGTIEMITQQVKQEILLLLMRIYSAWRGHSLLKETRKLSEQSQCILGNFPEISLMFHSSQTLSKSNLNMLNTLNTGTKLHPQKIFLPQSP